MGLAVGVTGGIGSGKSTVTGILAANGWQVIDVDRLAQNVYNEPGIRSLIIESFGENCFQGKTLNRPMLAKTVFPVPSRLQMLNRIVWPPMLAMLEMHIREMKLKDTVPFAADMAVLFEAQCQQLFDRILVVTAPVEDRIRRIKASRNLSETEIRQRIANQLDDKIKCDQADYVIENTGTPGHLEEKTRTFIKWILSQ